jgi:hypothetical protein
MAIPSGLWGYFKRGLAAGPLIYVIGRRPALDKAQGRGQVAASLACQVKRFQAIVRPAITKR